MTRSNEPDDDDGVAVLLGPDADPVTPWHERPSGLLVPTEPPPTCVDLFSGCGGFSLGMIQAGFHVVGAVDTDFLSVHTYCVNLCRPGVRIHFDTEDRERAFERHLSRHLFPRMDRGRQRVIPFEAALAGDGWISGAPSTVPGCEHVWVADVRALRGADMLATLGLDHVDCVVGGPPCQGFSTIGKRDPNDPRNELVFEFVRLARELRAEAIVMENVPAIVSMTTPEGIPLMDVLQEMLTDGGWGTRQLIRKALVGRASARAFVRPPRSSLDTRPKGSRCAPR